jgi:hypothetical protein
MTDEQINAAIAEACGWTQVNAEHRSGKAPNADYVGVEFIPDYSNDLNAMHEAEAYLIKNTTMLDYTDQLYDLACKSLKELKIWNPYGATARQRAEAFLKTLGKWEEAK